MVSWLIVLSYVLALFFCAGREESSAGFTAYLLSKLWPRLSPVQLAQGVVAVRKTGHVLAYALLTVIVYGAARQTRKLRPGALFFAVGLALTVAVLDERYQMGLPHRSGSWRDVLLDGIGIGMAWLGIWLGTKKRKGREVGNGVENE